MASSRGSVHVFRGVYTEPDRAHPGQRHTVLTKRYYWRFYFHGRLHSGGPGQPTKGAAMALGERRRTDLRDGKTFDRHAMTWERVEALLVSEGRVRHPASYERLRIAVERHLRPYWHGWHVSDVTEPELVRYADHRQREGAANTTINLEMSMLRHALSLGKVSPMPKFPRLAYVPRFARFLPHELDAFVAALPEAYRGLVEAAAETGWRLRRELAPLEWSRVDFGPEAWACRCPATQHGPPNCQACGALRPGQISLYVGQTKTGPARAFPMTQRLRGILDRQRARVSALEQIHGRIIPTVFARDDGSRIGDFRKTWRAACEATGLRDRVPHHLRYTAIGRFFDAGLSVADAMALSGHKDVTNFMQYARSEPRQIRRAGEMLDRYEAPSTVVPLRPARADQ